MIPPPFRVAEMTQEALLTVVDLSCSPACRTSRLSDDLVVVKYEPARTYLTMTPLQWAALKVFGPGRSAPQVVFQLIVDRQCVPLREFYELVVKAHAVGILQQVGGEPPPPVKAHPWPWQVDGRWMRGVAAATVISALVAMILRPMVLPDSVFDLLGGWLLSCLAVSTGYFVAACVVRRANAEVYHPALRWRTLWPHFHADLGDAVMGGRDAMVDAGLMRLMPVFFTLCAAAFWESGVVLPLFATVMAMLSPFWWSPGLATIHALYGFPHEDAHRRFRFKPNRQLWHVVKSRWQHADLKFFGIHAVYTLLWLAIIFLATLMVLGANAAELWHRYVAAGGLHFTALALLIGLGATVLGTLGMFGWLGWIFVRDWWQEQQRLKIKPRPAAVSREAACELVAQTLLFRGLPEEDRAAVAAAAKVEEFPRDAIVLREGEAGDKLYIIYSGRVEVLREMNSGRLDPVAVLQPADVFGEVALLQTKVRTRSVRALEKCVLLSLTREVFESLVLTKLSRTTVEETIQKTAFLHRIPLARNWSTPAMTAFCRKAAFRDFREEEYIIREGEDNQFFHLLHEGELAVRKNGAEIALLKSGDFFGEISLLQNSVAKATIKARTPGRCLVMTKRDFLQFLAKDFILGLQFEAISSKRLGHAIFPLSHGNFDVLRG